MPKKKQTPLNETRKFLEVVHRLRKECPWDRKQTHKTLVRYLIEETYEAVEAIEAKRWDDLQEELGDLLLQIALHAELASEKKRFDFDAIAKSISEKMIVRHPHVFGDGKTKILSAAAQTKNWSRLKAKEKPEKGLLEGTPKAMPALSLSQRYGEITASVNFDWPDLDETFKKVEEELGELRAEISRKKKNREALEMEFGDVLFVLTRVASKLDIDAERALKKAAAKFEKRFSHMEKNVRKAGRSPSDLTLEEWEAQWGRAKELHRV